MCDPRITQRFIGIDNNHRVRILCFIIVDPQSSVSRSIAIDISKKSWHNVAKII